MSSPTIGTPASANFFAQTRVAGDEDRQGVDEPHARVDRALGVEAVGLLGAHGQVAHEHVGARVAQHLHDVGLGLVGLHDDLPVVGAEPVERAAARDAHAERRHVAEPDRVVRLGEDRLGHVLADLVRVDVERRDHLDVADVVSAELDVHQARHAVRGVGVLVVRQALDERRRAVAHADDRDTDGAHEVCSFLLRTAVRRVLAPPRSVSFQASFGLVTFVTDQVVEPGDVGSGCRPPVFHHGEPVVVGLVAAGVDRRIERRVPLGERRPAPLQQPDARLGRQVAEERQPHAEAGVLARGVAGRLLQQLEERPLTLAVMP